MFLSWNPLPLHFFFLRKFSYLQVTVRWLQEIIYLLYLLKKTSLGTWFLSQKEKEAKGSVYRGAKRNFSVNCCHVGVVNKFRVESVYLYWPVLLNNIPQFIANFDKKCRRQLNINWNIFEDKSQSFSSDIVWTLNLWPAAQSILINKGGRPIINHS